MSKPGPKKRYDSKMHFTIESEYMNLIESIADRKGLTKSAIIRRVLKENLEEFIQENDEQQDLLEELREENF